MRRLGRPIVAGLAWALLALGAVLFGSALWIRRTFGTILFDQLLLNLPGAGGTEVTGVEVGYARSFVIEAVVIPLATLAAGLVLFVLIKRGVHRAGARAGVLAVKPWLARILPALLAFSVFLVGAGVFGNTVNAWQYVRSIVTPLTMSDYYVVPETDSEVMAASLEQPGDTPKNLVLIFLESIEDQMANEELFAQNMLAPIEAVTADWATIPDYQLFAGGGWTMAGLVGSSCGVPLRGAGSGENDINSNEIGSGQSDFMPGAVCLGDVLAANGYQNVFLGGADGEFASKGQFLRSHGYEDVKDLDTWIEAGETELSDWGLSDRRLMENAKDEVVRLHESGQPFNLTLLTLDSHEPAHLFDYCAQDTDDELESAVRCSMEQVASFVEFLGEKGYLEDTVVVLTGDHPKMVGEAPAPLEALDRADNRTIFNRIWSPGGQEVVRAGADQLSMFATMLDLMQLGRADHRAGVGVSALVSSAPGSALELSDSHYQELIESRSRDLYRDLWGPKSLDPTAAA